MLSRVGIVKEEQIACMIVGPPKIIHGLCLLAYLKLVWIAHDLLPDCRLIDDGDIKVRPFVMQGFEVPCIILGIAKPVDVVVHSTL